MRDERCQRYCTLWWLAVSRSKYQQPQEAIKDPSSSLYFTIATALGRYPMATLRGSFAKVVVVDQPLCQELWEICNFPIAFDSSTGFYTTFWKGTKNKYWQVVKLMLRFSGNFILQHKSIIHFTSWIILIIPNISLMLILIQIHNSRTGRTPLSKWSKEIMKSQWRQQQTGISQGCPQSTSLLLMGSGISARLTLVVSLGREETHHRQGSLVHL